MGLHLEMPVRGQEGMGPRKEGPVGWGGPGGAGAAPGEAAEHVQALAVAPVQVQAEDRWEDKHHSRKVAANHDGRLGDRREGRKGWMKHVPSSTPPCARGLFVKPHLQGEGPQCGDGDQGGHEEGDHVVDGCERDAGALALQTLARALLPGQGRGHEASRQSEGEAWGLGTAEEGPQPAAARVH